jgi:hypothetical protein
MSVGMILHSSFVAREMHVQLRKYDEGQGEMKNHNLSSFEEKPTDAYVVAYATGELLRNFSCIPANWTLRGSRNGQLLQTSLSSTVRHLYKAVQIPQRHEDLSLEPRLHSSVELPGRVSAILARRGLTLHQVSVQTIQLYGQSSAYFVPHNLYYDLGLTTFSPSLYQLFAISKISGFRFYDWLRVFGFHPEHITRLQVLLPSKRTVLLDPMLDDPESWIPRFHDTASSSESGLLIPLRRLIRAVGGRRLTSVLPAQPDDFLYARIGYQDAVAFPDLLPGSIVRANTRVRNPGPPTSRTNLFLVQHANGIGCYRTREPREGSFPRFSEDLLRFAADRELANATILGVVDLEIRSLAAYELPGTAQQIAAPHRPLKPGPDDVRLSHLLRHARLGMGLSFREASALSRRIASRLGHEQYFVAPGSLSDYESRDDPPRHAHKAITLCSLYGMQLSTFLKSIGLYDNQESGKAPIPDSLVPRAVPDYVGDDEDGEGPNAPTATPFVGLFKEWEPLPFFLQNSLSDLSGLKRISLNDFFWVGRKQDPPHPLLVNAVTVMVNRLKKKPTYFRSRPLWQQPMYVLLRRDGTHICGCCSLEKDVLIVHPYYRESERLRNRRDAEVVGQVVMLARGV